MPRSDLTDDYGYAAEKLRATVEILAEHPGRIQERLADALVSQLHNVFEGPGIPWLDPDLERRRADLEERFSGPGTFDEMAAALSDDEAVEIAKELCALEAAVQDEHRQRA